MHGITHCVYMCVCDNQRTNPQYCCSDTLLLLFLLFFFQTMSLANLELTRMASQESTCLRLSPTLEVQSHIVWLYLHGFWELNFSPPKHFTD